MDAFAVVDEEELQSLKDKNKNRNTNKMYKHLDKLFWEMAITLKG